MATWKTERRVGMVGCAASVVVAAGLALLGLASGPASATSGKPDTRDVHFPTACPVGDARFYRAPEAAPLIIRAGDCLEVVEPFLPTSFLRCGGHPDLAIDMTGAGVPGDRSMCVRRLDYMGIPK